MSNRNPSIVRHPSGQPTGGQFAESHKPASGVTLAPAGPPNTHRGLGSMYRELCAIAERERPDGIGRQADLAEEWKDAIEQVPATPRGTMKSWMDAHNGQQVRTYQFTHDPGSDQVSNPWSPGSRTVQATKASSVQMDRGDGREPSTRDYAGCRVIGADGDVLAIESNFGDRKQVAVYIAQ